MTCPDCGGEFKRVCRVCQAARARRGMLQHQRRFLLTWLEGTLPLRVREYEGVQHLELFDDRWHAYCGVAMFRNTERRKLPDFPAGGCVECRKMLDELVAKARSQEA